MKRTELVFILDMSGSMEHLTDDTIGGFNSILKEQADKGGEVLVTTYVFNNDARMLHDRLPIEQVRPMTRRDYRASGCTALLDAIGEAIRHIVGIHRYARKEDLPEQTLFVITTDGMENASHRFTAERVKEMIRHEKEKYGWEFLFIGANIDAIATAKSYGIRPDNAVNYHADREGTAVVYEAVSEAVTNMRCGAPMSAAWNQKIAHDFNRRKKRR